MDDTLNKEENQKNIYVIKHKLAELPKKFDHWQMHIGDFRVIMQVPRDEYHPDNLVKLPSGKPRTDSIVHYEKLDVGVYETSKATGQESMIDLLNDSRFKNYKPIEYNFIDTPTGGHINLGNGTDMPLIKVCELIRYLHRLSNLTAFL